MSKKTAGIFSRFLLFWIVLSGVLTAGCQQTLSPLEGTLLDDMGNAYGSGLVLTVGESCTVVPSFSTSQVSWELTNSDDSVLTVDQQEDRFVLTAQQKGTAQIQLTASASGYSPLSMTLDVEVQLHQQSMNWTLVPHPDQLPQEEGEAENPLTPQLLEKLEKGAQTCRMDEGSGQVHLVTGSAVAVALDSAEGTTYTPQVIGEGVQVQLLQGNVLYIEGVSQGEATVVVTADRDQYESLKEEFTIVVNLPPLPVTLVPQQGKNLANLVLEEGEQTQIDCQLPQGITPELSADGNELVEVEVLDTSLLLTARQKGETTISVTVSGEGYESQTISIPVTVTGQQAVLQLTSSLFDDYRQVELTTGESHVIGLQYEGELSFGYAADTLKVERDAQGNLVVTGLAPGETTLTITCKAPDLEDNRQTITYRITDAPLTLTVSQTALRSQVGEKITVSYSTDPSDAVVSASVSGMAQVYCKDGVLTITPEEAGTITVVLTAQKEGYSPAQQEIVLSTAQEGTGSGSSQADSEESQGEQTDAQQADALLALTNEARQKEGLSPLTRQEDLDLGAQIRAQEIVTHFSHTRPDGTPFYTVFGVEENYYYGENIAYNYDTAQQAMDAWMSSEGHRENILNSTYTGIGIATIEKDGQRYWVQIFYRPGM